MSLKGKPFWILLLCGVGVFILTSGVTYLITLLPPPFAPSTDIQETGRRAWSGLTGLSMAFAIVGPHVEVKVSTKMKVRMTLIGYLLVVAILVGLELVTFRYPDTYFAGGATGYKIFAVLAGLAAFAYSTEHLVRDIMRLMPQESSQANKAASVLGHKVQLKGSGPQRPAIHPRRDGYKAVAYGGRQPISRRLRRR